MDQASAQTEKISTYETSRTRRSIVDGNIHSDDSNNDEEYASSGFYVREKTTEKRPDSSSRISKESDKACKENGVSPQANPSPRPVENGENADDEDSNDSKKDDTDQNSDEQSVKKDDSGSKENIEPENDDTTDSAKELDGKNQESDNESDGVVQNAEENVDKTEDCDKIEEDDSSTSKHVEEEGEVDKEDSEEKESGIVGVIGEDVEKGEDETEEIADSKKESEIKEEKENNEEKSDQDNDHGTKDKNDTENDLPPKEDDKQEQADSSTEIDEKKSDRSKSSASKGDKKYVKSDEAETVDVKDKEKSEGSILKEQLEKTANGNSEENVETEMEMDEDFDPSLLCPDISMDVDEAPVITNTENVPEDGNTSPLPYEATFSTLVDEITGAEVQVDLTPEEMELRQKMYGPNNLVQNTKIHCTACNIHLGSALTGANNRFVHPLLKVLICKNCYHFYTSGEFEKDEDGSELYCRWCGQGGQVLCCSSCEFVFCKRCIRNNFGPKKFKEIRDSDDWNCFRCDRGQLSNLRASCAEFMEYYRTELARAQSLSQTNPELMTTDYTTCCKAGQEKKEEPKPPAPQKNTRRKRKDEEDPDYQPLVEDADEPPKKKFGTSVPSGGPGYTVIPPTLRPVLPKTSVGQIVRPVVTQQGQKPQNQGQVFKVGNTTFRARAPNSGPGYTVQRPTVSQGQKSNSPGYITIPPSSAPKSSSPGYITIPPSAVPKTTSPGYIKILPQRMQSPRPSNTYTVVSGTSNGKPTFTTVRPKQPAPMPTMKHEWFEKTVRAAARVNSNLSYTLTQLNRQQSQANSVEALAMVHNKLQEVLSTSINSLIQIRKNLRTEFISGIKNIKFPPKPAPIPPTSGPIVVKDDDDVIFVSPPKTTASLPPPPPLVLSPAVTLTKKTPIQKTSDPFADPKPSTSGVSNKANNASKPSTTSTPSKGGFLKVRSFTALQSVPSECITIPDDPPVSSNEKAEEDPLKITDDDKPKDDEPETVKSPLPQSTSTFDEFMVYNVKDEPTPAIKKMLNAVVMVKKSRVVDEIIRAQGLLIGPTNKPKEKEIEGDEKLNASEKESDRDEKGNKSGEEENGNGTGGAEVKVESDKEEDETSPEKEEKEIETVDENTAKSEEETS